MNLRRVLTWLVIAFVIFYVVKQPEHSANIVRSAGEMLQNVAASLARFVGNLS